MSYKEKLLSELNRELEQLTELRMEYSNRLMKSGSSSRLMHIHAKSLTGILKKIVWLENMINLAEEIKD